MECSVNRGMPYLRRGGGGHFWWSIEIQWGQWNRLGMDTLIVKSAGAKISVVALLRIKTRSIPDTKFLMWNKVIYENVVLWLTVNWNYNGGTQFGGWSWSEAFVWSWKLQTTNESVVILSILKMVDYFYCTWFSRMSVSEDKVVMLDVRPRLCCQKSFLHGIPLHM